MTKTKEELIAEFKEQVQIAQDGTVALEEVVDKVFGETFLLSRVRLSNLWLEEDTLDIEQTGEDLEFKPIKLDSFSKEQLKQLIKALQSANKEE